jgi:hypothetical protein
MHLARHITILLAGLAIASATPRHASAQSEFELDSAQGEFESDADMSATAAVASAVIEQHALAQAGLGQGFMFRLLQSQLSIGDTENNGVRHKCKQLPSGGSIMLKSRVGSFTRKSAVDVYYDAACKQVFIESLLNLDEPVTNHFSIVETATFHKMPPAGKPVGGVSGKLTLKSIVTKTATVVHFTGTGTWTPTGGAKLHGALKCDYPRKLKGAKPFTCSFAMAQPSSTLRLDVASAMVLKFKVSNALSGNFDGAFAGPGQLFTGAFGKLGVVAPPNNAPATVSGPHRSLGTATAKGSVRLAVFWPPPASWTMTDVAHTQSFTVEMPKGPSRVSAGTITHGKKTLATFSVDNTGEGSISYAGQKAKIVNWLPAN